MKKLFLTISLLLGLLLNAQIGITVTTDIKQANGDLFQNYTVNSIRVFGSIPKSFAGPSKNYQRTDGYQHLHDSIHFNDGFKNVVTPSYDIATEKLGAIVDQDSIFTYTIIPLTQQEIDAKVEQLADGEATTTESTRQGDGDAEARYIFKNLRRLNNDGVLTNNQFKMSQDLLFDALLPMIYGLWDVAKTRLDAIPNPANATLLNVLTTIRARIDFYVANNIRQDE